MRRLTISFSACVMLGGCASALKFENVTGSWTCPRIDGKCETISDIDAGLQDRQNAFAIAPSAGDHSIPIEAPRLDEQLAPVRTGDEIARIVLAPAITASGYYVGVREIYAVMRSGAWRAPDMADPQPNPPPVDSGAKRAHPARPMIQGDGNGHEH